MLKFGSTNWWMATIVFNFLLVMSAEAVQDTSFLLYDRWGASHELSKTSPLSSLVEEKPRAYVVVFLSPSCPLVNAKYGKLLRELNTEFRPQGIQFLGIYSNWRTTRLEMASHHMQLELPFPVFLDDSSALAKHLQAERVPEVFLLKPDLEVVYSGAIDGAFEKAKHGEDLKREDGFLYKAIQSFLKGENPELTSTASNGCRIEFAPEQNPNRPQPDFGKSMKIMQQRCLVCHQSGGVGRPQLETLEDIVANAETIAEKVKFQVMPPWHADTDTSLPLKSQFLMPQEERETLVSWLEAGSPLEGAPLSQPLPTGLARNPEEFSIGNGKPDWFVQLSKPFKVPAGTELEYQFFWVPNPYNEDRWIQEIEFIPGNTEVVHHGELHLMEKSRRGEFLSKLPNGQFDFTQALSGPDYTRKFFGFNGEVARRIAVYIPGNEHNRMTFPTGMATRLPKDMDLVIQLHYTPSEKNRDEWDQSKIGMMWASGEPETEIFNNAFYSGRDIHIPAFDPDVRYELKRKYFPEDIVIYDVRPHMQYRGADFELIVESPDGTRETLLQVPAYDFEWQHTYLFDKPITLPAGHSLYTKIHWDNSRLNPHINLMQAATDVMWGQQSYQEMNNFAITWSKKKK